MGNFFVETSGFLLTVRPVHLIKNLRFASKFPHLRQSSGSNWEETFIHYKFIKIYQQVS